MGFSLSDFQAGVADVGKVLQQGSDLWGQITGKASKPTTTAQPASPAAPASSGQTLTQGGSGFASIPPWLMLAGVVVALVALKRG
jgi:hypothetical protein